MRGCTLLMSYRKGAFSSNGPQLLQESYSKEKDYMNTAFLDDSDVDQMDTNEF